MFVAVNLKMWLFMLSTQNNKSLKHKIKVSIQAINQTCALFHLSIIDDDFKHKQRKKAFTGKSGKLGQWNLLKILIWFILTSWGFFRVKIFAFWFYLFVSRRVVCWMRANDNDRNCTTLNFDVAIENGKHVFVQSHLTGWKIYWNLKLMNMNGYG